MKLKSITCFALIISFMFLLTGVVLFKVSSNRVDKIYVLSGESKDIEIKNGYVKKSGKTSIIDFGVLNSLFDIESMESYTMSFYFNQEGQKHILFTKSMFNKSNFNISDLSNYSIGTSKEILSESEFKNLIDNFYFSLDYNGKSNNSFHITTKLCLKKIT